MPYIKKILFFTFLFTCFTFQGQDTGVTRVNINSRESEFSPAFYENGIVFISSRKTDALSAHLDESGNYTSDFYFSSIENGELSKVQLFSEDLATKLNEGPCAFSSDFKTIYFTKNIRPNHRNGNEVLGIFTCTKELDKWSIPKYFKYNSRENEFDVAHPSLSQDGKSLYFSSNKPGGYGGYDIYFCKIDEFGIWGEPQNAGENINTTDNEGYPFILNNNKLHFSSSGYSENKGMDILYSTMDLDGSFTPPILMEAPINSNKNDYGFVVDATGKKGYFTSDRIKKYKDDIYSFELNYPEFENCQENYEPSLCYLIQDENIDPMSELPLIFEWNLGDGEVKKGKQIEYCFPGYGSYDISLSIYDTLTGQKFAEVSQVIIDIEMREIPHISCPDTILINEKYTFEADQLDNIPFVVGDIYWDFSGMETATGSLVEYTFQTPGNYRISLGVEGLASPETEKICVYKDILVMDDDYLARIENEKVFRDQGAFLLESMNALDVNSLKTADLALDNKSLKIDSSLYFIELKKSTAQIPLNDVFFTKTEHEITERYRETEDLYVYSVGEVYEIANLYYLYNELVDSGYVDIVVHEDLKSDFDGETTKKGYYMSDELKKEMNEKINNFSNILFATNSFEILPQSYGNLDQVVKVMQLEQGIKLRIMAHTDNQGADYYNLDLSVKRAKSVVDYLNSKGINKNRLTAFGYGSEKPLETNDTEKGRSANRRVEFEIITEEVFN